MAERPEDLNLPTSVITRIVKEALPDNVNLSKDARAAFSKAASVFVLYATSCANNYALKAKRKTLTSQDVLNAMTDMDFERFLEPLKECLEAFKKEQREKKTAAEKRKAERDLNTSENQNGQDEGNGQNESGDNDEGTVPNVPAEESMEDDNIPDDGKTND